MDKTILISRGFITPEEHDATDHSSFTAEVKVFTWGGDATLKLRGGYSTGEFEITGDPTEPESKRKILAQIKAVRDVLKDFEYAVKKAKKLSASEVRDESDD